MLQRSERLVQPVCDYADYCFDSEDDKAVALAARLSILTRKDLDVAPAFLLVGPERGTGKTTLAAIDHVIATGYDIPVAELEKEPDKAKQTLFSVFNSSPAAVLFDNLPANSAFGSLALTKSLTKSEFEVRGFYTQTEVRASTNVQVYLTGNAIVLDEDLQSRTLEIRFSPERPTRWSHPDWLAHARGVREDYRTKLQFIQRAYIRHGDGAAGVVVRFPAWAKRVRDPLLWAGLQDVGKRLLDLESKNPNRAIDGAIVAELARRYPDTGFSAGDVADDIGADQPSASQGFEVLRALFVERVPRAVSKNAPQDLGNYFRESLKRWFDVEGQRIRLESSNPKNVTTWKVAYGS